MRLLRISRTICKNMRYLADTQSFLWFIMGEDSLAKHHRIVIADTSNEIFLSVASLWEIVIKVSIGKLDLKMTFLTLLEEHIGRFTLLHIAPDHLIELERLPYYPHHRDPFDRIIIAQSIAEDLEVITTDLRFKNYGIRLLK
jgi:PIN domain nuclease of toxin-antitoxin system